jgi:hypothetical protein
MIYYLIPVLVLGLIIAFRIRSYKRYKKAKARREFNERYNNSFGW